MAESCDHRSAIAANAHHFAPSGDHLLTSLDDVQRRGDKGSNAAGDGAGEKGGEWAELAGVCVDRARFEPLVPEECPVGRLLRPTPLPANRNCVVSFVNESESLVQLSLRVPETDVMLRTARSLAHCQRAEASLAAQFP